MTRASYALIQGDLGLALEMNPLAGAMVPIGLAPWLHEGLGRPQQWERMALHLRDARL